MKRILLSSLLFLLGCSKEPPPADCRALSWRCQDGRPQVCSGGWYTEGDQRCDTTPGQVCALNDAGRAVCTTLSDGGVE